MTTKKVWPVLPERDCGHCQQPYTPTRAWQRWCSPSCRSRAWLTRTMAGAITAALQQQQAQAKREKHKK